MIEHELQHRQLMFRRLVESGGPTGVEPQLLRQLNFYQGQAGIWRDANRTAQIGGDNVGLTVSLLHRGDHYPDDLRENGLTYHYPNTARAGNTDQNEIDATKAAAILQLPIFIITTNEASSSLRDVRIGFVVEWSDETETFVIEFLQKSPGRVLVEPRAIDDQEPFVLDDVNAVVVEAVVANYLRNPLFKRQVVNRYGASCAVCDIQVIDLLDGAHLKGKKFRGSDDPRNGLVLCATHHRAFDRGLFFIHPETLDVHAREGGPSLGEIGIVRSNIRQLKNLPHREALEWLWGRRVAE